MRPREMFNINITISNAEIAWLDAEAARRSTESRRVGRSEVVREILSLGRKALVASLVAKPNEAA